MKNILKLLLIIIGFASCNRQSAGYITKPEKEHLKEDSKENICMYGCPRAEFYNNNLKDNNKTDNDITNKE